MEAFDFDGSTENKIEFESFSDDKYVIVRVSDNGQGIPEHNLQKIFNHGFSTKERGHGFGLHSCANYMTEMGGEIRAESRVPKGTSFILSFPIQPTVSPQDWTE